MHPRGEIAAPERRGEARGKPPRRRAWLRKPMVSKQIGERPTGNRPPASRPCLKGQRLHPTVVLPPKGDRDLALILPNPKDARGKPDLPPDQSGYRDERDWSIISRHLQASAEDIDVNVGGPCMEGAVPDEVHGRRSHHSTRSAGKPRTWGRVAACWEHRAK
jgi:hypothetical protein